MPYFQLFQNRETKKIVVTDTSPNREQAFAAYLERGPKMGITWESAPPLFAESEQEAIKRAGETFFAPERDTLIPPDDWEQGQDSEI